MTIARPSRYDRFRDGFLAGCVGVLLMAISLVAVWLSMIVALALAALGAAIATARIWVPIVILIGIARLMGAI